jgi:hypothetical protein
MLQEKNNLYAKILNAVLAKTVLLEDGGGRSRRRLKIYRVGSKKF